MSRQLILEWEGVLAEESEVLSSLIDLLKREREAIITMDLAALTAIEKEKHEQILRIQILEVSSRGMAQQVAHHYGLAGEPPVEQILPYLPADQSTERFRHLLSCLKSMAQAVLELNEGHRRYLTHSLTGIEASLSLLSVLTGDGRMAGYTASGDYVDPSGTGNTSVRHNV